jgi:adenylate cyclase
MTSQRLLTANPGRVDERRWPISGSVRVGRNADNDVELPDLTVSRYHAEIVVTETGVRLVDLASRFGTMVNGERIDAVDLHDGDQLRFGDVACAWLEREPDLIPTLVRSIHTPRPMSELLGRSGPGATVVHGAGADDARARLEILIEVGRSLSSAEPLDVVLGRILDLVFRILDVHAAAVLLADNDRLVPRLARLGDGAPSDSLAAAAPSDPAPAVAAAFAEIAYSQTIADWVHGKGVAALFSAAQADPRFTDVDSLAKKSIQGSMAVPLVVRDVAIGVLYVDHRRARHPWNEHDLEFLAAFGGSAAIAIENARLLERLERETTARASLRRFFPPSLLDAIEVDGGIRTVDATVTALFCDISAYMGMCARMDPRELLALLNEWFVVASEIVFRHGGTLEKYIGDALLAVWGAPLARPDDADRALAAAIDLQRAVVAFNATGRWEPIAVHIGLHSGKVAAGNIGSDSYVQYAAIGHATSLASRICSVAAPREIVASVDTLGRLAGPRPEVEVLAPVRVKGEDQELHLVRVAWG